MQTLRINKKLILNSRYVHCSFAVVLILLVFIISQNKDEFSYSSLKVEKFIDKTPRLKTPIKPIKILCYILLSRYKVRTAMLIKETWGSHCDSLLFFGGYEFPDLPVIRLNVTEGYVNLWGKAKAALMYLSQDPKFKEFQFFLKADDDTFVIVENLRRFIHISRQLLLDEPVWFGFKLKHRRMPQGYMSGGAAYVFNYQALKKVAPVFSRNSSLQIQGEDSEDIFYKNRKETCNIDGEYGIEDLELGKCFLFAGVKPIDTADQNDNERFLPLSYDMLLNGAIPGYHWIWRQSWNRVKAGSKCCSEDLISMHEISPNQMNLIYHLLYKTNIWKLKT